MRKDATTEEWIRLPMSAVQDKDLTLADVLVLAYVIDQTNGTEKPLSEKHIAEKMQIAERQVKASIKRLEETGYITVSRRAGKKSLYKHTNVLPPKGKKIQPSQPKTQKSGLDLEKYKIFINSDLDLEEYGNEQQAERVEQAQL